MRHINPRFVENDVSHIKAIISFAKIVIKSDNFL